MTNPLQHSLSPVENDPNKRLEFVFKPIQTPESLLKSFDFRTGESSSKGEQHQPPTTSLLSQRLQTATCLLRVFSRVFLSTL